MPRSTRPLKPTPAAVDPATIDRIWAIARDTFRGRPFTPPDLARVLLACRLIASERKVRFVCQVLEKQKRLLAGPEGYIVIQDEAIQCDPAAIPACEVRGNTIAS